jgi:hypothetical protein
MKESNLRLRQIFGRHVTTTTIDIAPTGNRTQIQGLEDLDAIHCTIGAHRYRESNPDFAGEGRAS